MVGMDYPAILDCADRFGPPVDEKAFAQLQLLEGWELERHARERERAMQK